MPRETALPRLIGATALLIALLACLVPASALAAEEGFEPPLPEGPVLALAPVAFPKTTVGTESPSQPVDVVNEGGEAALIEGAGVEGPDAAAFRVANNGCGKLFPAEHCTVWVSFAPGETGEKQAFLTIKMGNAPTATLPLAASSVPAQLEFAPASHDFGIVRANETSSTGLQLTNAGEATVQVNNLGVGGPDSNYFWIGNSDCWGRTMAPGESCSLEANFNPREPRPYEAEVQVSANGSNFAAALTGSGGLAQLEPEVNPVDLGAATVGSHGEVRTIVLTNHGNFAGGYFIAVIAGGDSASFQLLDESCTGEPVAPEATCLARVRFTPQSPGPKRARLALFGDAEGGTMIFLEGEGLAPEATLAPGGFDFGAAPLGSHGAAHTFTVRNEGAAALALDGVSLVGADPDQFALAGDECTDAVLAPGGECAVRVRFAPDRAGAASARLRIAGPAGPFAATLAGTAVVPDPIAGPGGPGAFPRHHRHRRPRSFRRGTTLDASRAR